MIIRRKHNTMTRGLAAMLSIMVAFAVLAAPSPSLRAAAPNDVVSYQGRLLNSEGAPVADASLEFVFRLYSAVSGESCLWESDDGAACDGTDETQTVALTDGLFSENIGSTDDPTGLSEAYPVTVSGIFEDNADVFLEVEVAGEILTPRKRIAAAPYALNSQTLDGLDSAEFLAAAGDTASGIFDFSGAVLSGASPISFEGLTADDFESTFAFVDPTADRTITFQNAGGTVAFTSDIPAGSSLWETGAVSTFEDDDDVVIGSSATETILNVGFSLSGNDLFVAGDAGVEGSVYSDGSFIAGTTTFAETAITATDNFTISMPNELFIVANRIVSVDPGTTSLGASDAGWTNVYLDVAGIAIGLEDVTDQISSGAFVIGAFDEFANTAETNVQGVLDDLDAAISTGGTGAMWTLAGGVAYPTSATNDFAVGGTAAATSPFGVDESANTVYVGEGANGNGTVAFKASDADAGSLSFTTNDQFSFTGGTLTLGSDTISGVNAGFTSDGDDFFATGHIAAQDNMYADAFVAGDASTTFADGSLTTTGTTDFSFVIAGGDLTFAQATVIGDGGDILSLDSTDWDISTTGGFSGVESFASDTNQAALNANVPVSGADAALHTISFQIDGNSGFSIAATGDGAGGVGARTVLVGQSASADVVTVGDANADVSISDAQWSVSAAGLFTTADDVAVNGGDVTSTGTLTIDSSGIVQLGTNDSFATTGSVTNTLVGTETILVTSTPGIDTTVDAMKISFAAAHSDLGAAEKNYGLHIVQADSGLAPEYGADALLYLENAAPDGPSVGLLVGGGTFGYGIDLSGMTSGTDIALSNTEFISNVTDDVVLFSGANGTDNTDIQFDLDGTMPVIASFTDASVSIADNLLVGGTTAAGVKATFVLSGDDIYAAGDIAAQFNVYADTFVAGDASTTFSDGAVSTTSQNFLTNIGVTGTDALVHTMSLQIDGNVGFSIAATGDGAGGVGARTLTVGGLLDASNNLVTNIGNAGTDFVSGGGLTLAGAFTANADADFILDPTENVLISAPASTVTTGVLDLNVDSAVTGGFKTAEFGLTMNDGAADGDDFSGLSIALQGDDASGDMFGLAISSKATANAAAGTYENFILVSNAENTVGAVTDAIKVTSTSGVDGDITTAINVSAASIGTALSVGDNDIVGTFAKIDFSEFDVSGTTGSVTINDGGNAGSVNVEGTILDINGLGFVGSGSVSAIAGDLLLDASTGQIAAADGDGFRLQGTAATDDAASDSPNLTMRGSYDSTNGPGVTVSVREAVIAHDVSVLAGVGSSLITFNIGGGAVEMNISDAGDIKTAGGATLGDLTGTDQFVLTTAVSTADAFQMVADSEATADVFDISADGLTTGRGIFLERADNGTSFISTAGLLTVSMLDATSSGDAANFINSGTGSAVFVDQNGNTGTTIDGTTGGALHVDNTSNTNFGLTVYTNQAISASSLAKFYSANVGFDDYVVEIESGALTGSTSNGTALHIIQNEVDGPGVDSVGTQALVIDVNEADPGAGADDFDDAVIIVRADADGGAAARTKFRVDLDGDVHYDGVASTDAQDIAERYHSVEPLVPGDVVVLDPARDGVIRSTRAYQSGLVGAISTRPGVGLGPDLPDTYYLALKGRIPVNISAENGSIEVGDPITSSGTQGYGMKATEAGSIIGYALAAFAGPGTGTIEVFVENDYYVGNIFGTDGSATIVSDDLTFASTGTATASTPGFASRGLALRGSGWNGTSAADAQMTLVTDVTDASDYNLSIRNTAGTSVAYVSNEGDLALSGRLYPSDRGAIQTSKYIYYDGAAGMGGDFMRTNASGWATGSYDFAEMFPSSDALTAGDVVVFGTDNESVARSRTAASPGIAGIVSTRPGFLAGDNQPGHYPIALAGRVPTKVTAENGDIAIGDPLTSSSADGYAMKATESGQIVGYALEPFDGSAEDDKIIAFVNVSYWNGGPTADLPGTNNQASTIVVTQNASNLSALNMNGNIYLSGNEILGVGRISGLSGRWSVDAEGTLVTEGVVKTAIESYQGEIVETTALTSPETLITLFGTGTLENGEAVIRFEEMSPEFNDVTSTTAPIRVLVTPNGPVSLYVYEKNNDGFGVRQVSGVGDGVTFDWMVSAYRKDYEPEEEPVVVDAPVEEVVVDEVSVDPAVVAEPVEEEETIVDPIFVADEPAPPVSPDVPPSDEGTSQPSDSVESTVVEEPAL